MFNWNGYCFSNKPWHATYRALLDIVLKLNKIKIPYSAKFSRHLYFVDWPLKTISLHNVRGMTAYRKPRL